jgi:ribonuclease P/MRP protein subunit RPP1
MPAVDLHVCLPYPRKEADSSAILTQALKLGLTGLGIQSQAPIPEKIVPKNLQLFSRTTLSPRSAARLRHRVERVKDRTDLLVVHGRTKPIWLAAAEIPTVDLILLLDLDDFTNVDSQMARLSATLDKPVEICLHGLLTLKGPARSRLMRAMGYATEYLLRAKAPIVLTSGAQTLWQLRTPRDLAALAYLAHIPEVQANQAVLEFPNKLVGGRPS